MGEDVMRLSIMQPYFFPYLGYFSLIANSDCWIVYDTAQDIKHGWVDRNRILHPTSGWQYISVPRKKHPLDTQIRDVRIAGDEWKSRIRGQIDHYRKKAPYFHVVNGLLSDCFSFETESLSELNSFCLKSVCDLLEITFEPLFASSIAVTNNQGSDACEKVLAFCQWAEATQYVNPPGGAVLYDAARFDKVGVKLVIQDYTPLEYQCPGYEFERGLSILDVLMWNSPDIVKDHLQAGNGC